VEGIFCLSDAFALLRPEREKVTGFYNIFVFTMGYQIAGIWARGAHHVWRVPLVGYRAFSHPIGCGIGTFASQILTS
jgi:hypothetical protein